MKYILKRFAKSYRLAYYRFTGRWKWGLIRFIREVPYEDLKEVDKYGTELKGEELDNFLEELYGRLN